MLKELAAYLTQYYSGFNVFNYITLRGVLSALTALAVSLMFGGKLITILGNLRVSQPVRKDGPRSHLSKEGTPVMGGVLILVAIVFSTVMWGDLSNRYVIAALLVTLLFGLIGGIDDLVKLRHATSSGLSIRQKLLWQILLTSVVIYWLYASSTVTAETSLVIPFVKDLSVSLGVWFIPFAILTIVASSNAVNLTDGLDGLAIMPAVLVTGALSVFAYASGHVNFSDYLGIPHLPLSGELFVYCGAIGGAGLGFLWFNTYPAQVFMGDVGALSLGAAIGALAVLVRQEIVLVIIGGLFVIEALSVIVQVISYRLTGRRVFQMAPIHHHFELRGWAEPKIVIRFWIITFILVLVGLASLKVR